MSAGKKILIFTASYGHGHNKASEALYAAFKEIRPDWEVQISDFLKSVHPILNSVTQRMYLQSIKSTPVLYGQFYQQTHNISRYTSLPKKMHRLGREKMIKLLSKIRPDAIISTFPFPSGVVSHLKEVGIIDIPLATVVTDYTLHEQWIHDNVDLFFVGHDMVKQYLLERGVSERKVHVSGIPIHPKYSQDLGDRMALRRQYGFCDELPVIFLMGGAFGNMPGLKKIFRLLYHSSLPLQMIVVCGKNVELLEKFQAEVRDNPRHQVLLLGYEENVHKLMAISDLIITKSGGLTVSESMAMHLPMLIYRPIPGQELANARFLQKHGAGKYTDHLQEFYSLVEDLVLHPEKREEMRRCTQKIARPQAAFEVAQTICRVVESNVLATGV